MKEIKIKLETLTPVHIGTGEVYEPLSFFVSKEENFLFEVDFEKVGGWLIKKGGKDKFLKLAQSGNLKDIIKLYELFEKICNALYQKGIKSFIKRKVKVFPDFVEHYTDFIELGSRKISERELMNNFKRFEIHRTAILPNSKQLYVPASSLKGSIRTAVLNLKRTCIKKSVEDYKKNNKKYDGKLLEKDILRYRKPAEDPFKYVKISDLSPLETGGYIVYAVNRKKNGTRASGPFQMFEVIKEGSIFEGKVVFDERFIKKEDILKALKHFYGKEFEKERGLLYRLGINLNLPEEGVPVRIGRHSGAECITVEGFRKIRVRIKGGYFKFLPYSTTLWLASEDRKGNKLIGPFGWAILKFT